MTRTYIQAEAAATEGGGGRSAVTQLTKGNVLSYTVRNSSFLKFRALWRTKCLLVKKSVYNNKNINNYNNKNIINSSYNKEDVMYLSSLFVLSRGLLLPSTRGLLRVAGQQVNMRD